MNLARCLALPFLRLAAPPDAGRGHSVRFQSFTRQLLFTCSAASLLPGLSPEELELISLLAPLHDIGKHQIPPSILNKPGKLTAEEFEIMKLHTVYGCRLLSSVPECRRSCAYRYAYHICRHHHERSDGTGYPDGLASAKIAPWVQVVSLADVYDALTSHRVYRPAIPPDEALDMVLAGECGTFDPQLLNCFASLVRSHSF